MHRTLLPNIFCTHGLIALNETGIRSWFLSLTEGPAAVVVMRIMSKLIPRHGHTDYLVAECWIILRHAEHFLMLSRRIGLPLSSPENLEATRKLYHTKKSWAPPICRSIRTD